MIMNSSNVNFRSTPVPVSAPVPVFEGPGALGSWRGLAAGNPGAEPRGTGIGEVAERVARWQRELPREARLMTGQIVLVLSKAPQGLSKRDLMEKVTGERLASRSFTYVEALDVAFSKRIQRSRARIRSFGLDIVFERKSQRWVLVERGNEESLLMPWSSVGETLRIRGSESSPKLLPAERPLH